MRAFRDRDRLMLEVWAEAELRGRRKRYDFLPAHLLGEPAWDILLDLYIRRARRKPVPASSLYESAADHGTSGSRGLAALEREGLVERTYAITDEGEPTIGLTDAGSDAVVRWLRYRAALLA